MGILDFFSREAGQERRRALDSLLSQFIPPTARPQFNLLGELNPVVAMERAGQDAQRIGATQGWERVGATGDMLSNMAGVVAPALAMRGAGRPVAQAVEEGLLGFSTSPQGLALGDFVADEFGGVGFRLYQGSPHDFAAERLVRMPDGSTQYIVGRPNVLPDVPAGAEVLRDFPLGRMRMDKIGTGEGAQAYGHGLYAAENEGVARWYRDALSLDAGFSYKGREGLTREQLAEAITADYGGKYLDNIITPRGVADGVMDELIYGPSQRKLGPERAALRERLLAEIQRTDPGRMYEANVNANPEDFLDWDKPLSEQPKIANALGYADPNQIAAKRKELYATFSAPKGDTFDDLFAPLSAEEQASAEALSAMPMPWGRMTGKDAYEAAKNRLGALDWPVGADAATRRQFYGQSAARASEAMREAGIPGIRYLDQTSRGAGDGSRNYVIFDENLITIIRKYGIAGAAAMLGMSQADLAQAMERQQQSQPMGLLNMGAR